VSHFQFPVKNTQHDNIYVLYQKKLCAVSREQMNMNPNLSILCDDDFLCFVNSLPEYPADQLIAQVRYLPEIFSRLEGKEFDELEEIRVTNPSINAIDHDILYLVNFHGPHEKSMMVPVKAEIFIKAPKVVIPKDIIDIRIDTNGKFRLDVRAFDQIIKKDGGFGLSGVVYGSSEQNRDAILKELEDTLNDSSVSEKDLQLFLERHPDLLKGSEYQTVIPQVCINSVDRLNEKSWQADFLLKPFSQTDFCKLIELKVPGIPIQLKKSGHQKFSHQLNSAIRQINDYASAFNEMHTRKKFKEKYGFDVINPEMHIIIGRECDIVDTKALMDFQKKQNVKIEDWDTFLKKLKAV
jgi:hypothetical protein